jgi:hypothetical protein
MKITLRELRTLVRESVRQHLKENEDKPGKSYMVTGPFIGATGPTYAGDSRYVDLVKDIFDKFSWENYGQKAIHNAVSIDRFVRDPEKDDFFASYPEGLEEEMKPALEAAKELAKNLYRFKTLTSSQEAKLSKAAKSEYSRKKELLEIIRKVTLEEIGNVKKLAISAVAEKLGLDPKDVLRIDAVKNYTIGLSSGLTLENLAGIAQAAAEEFGVEPFSAEKSEMSLQELRSLVREAVRKQIKK